MALFKKYRRKFPLIVGCFLIITALITIVYDKNVMVKQGTMGLQVQGCANTCYPITGTGAFVVNGLKQFYQDNLIDVCRWPKNLKAVLPIYSSPDRFELRQILRNTLGKWAKKLNCKIFFIIGLTYNASLNEMVKNEYIKKKDILMMGRIDAYRDLNDKAVAMVEYLSKYCRHVPYTIHLIDDTFINLELFLKRMDSIELKSYMLGGGMLIPTPRNTSLKTFVTKEEYDKDWFPVFAIGFVYAFPTVVADQLLSAVYTAPYCWIEDVWFSGHVRETAGVKLVILEKEAWEEFEKAAEEAVGLPKYMFIHPVRASLFPKLYASVID